MGPRASFQTSPPASRASRNSVSALHVRGSPSHARRLSLLRDIKRDNTLRLPIVLELVPVVLQSVLQVSTMSLVCQYDVNMTFAKKEYFLWARIFSIILSEGESIFSYVIGCGSWEISWGCWRAKVTMKVDFVNKFCKQLTIRHLYLNASISTLNCQTHNRHRRIFLSMIHFRTECLLM